MPDPIPDKETLEFYRQQSPLSSPGRHSAVLETLPTDPAELCRVIQGFLVHQFWVMDEANYGISPGSLKADGRDLNAEINLRSIEVMLDAVFKLDESPLDASRVPARRLVGNCRDYSLFVTSVLRIHGIPARVRSGVARYFYPDDVRLEDHYVCEFWNSDTNRWQMVDAQIDERQRQVLGCTLDTTDLPRDQFLVGVEAYHELNDGRVTEEKIGIGEFTGWPYVWYTLFTDLACVCGCEILPWEGWGVVDRISSDTLSEGDRRLLGQIVEVLNDLESPGGIARARELFTTDPDLVLPADYRPYFHRLSAFT